MAKGMLAVERMLGFHATLGGSPCLLRELRVESSAPHRRQCAALVWAAGVSCCFGVNASFLKRRTTRTTM